MALSGVHITFGYAHDAGGYKSGSTLPYNATASETMATPGTSSISAPKAVGIGDLPLLSVSTSAAIFYVVGPAPDINNGPRRYLDPASGAREDIFVDAGDKVAWTTA